MKIGWIYLDIKSAALSALRDYTGMEHIIQNHQDNARELRAHLTSVNMPRLSGIRGKPNPRASENKMAATLDLIDLVEERYQQALEYMAWFRPAWAGLSDEEQLILSAFCQWSDIDKAMVVRRLCDLLGLEKTAVYTRKDKAAGHLAFLLYGK
jgi:hypothetical protein